MLANGLFSTFQREVPPVSPSSLQTTCASTRPKPSLQTWRSGRSGRCVFRNFVEEHHVIYLNLSIICLSTFFSKNPSTRPTPFGGAAPRARLEPSSTGQQIGAPVILVENLNTTPHKALLRAANRRFGAMQAPWGFGRESIEQLAMPFVLFVANIAPFVVRPGTPFVASERS